MKIKRSLFLIGLLAGVTAIHAQTRADTQLIARDTTNAAPARKATKDSLIKNIRAIFQRINHDTTLHTVGLDEDTMEEITGGSPDNGGDVTGYFKNDTLYKIVMSFGPSYGMKDWEYYYDQGQVVFIYEKDQHFPVTRDGLDHARLVPGFEGRFYFNKGRLFAKIIKRYDQFMAEKIDDNYIRNLLDDLPSFANALRREMKKKKN